MLCLRRSALRVLSASRSVSLPSPSIKARSITRLTYPVPVKSNRGTAFGFLQRRQYADEAASTQSEPQADGATEAQQGNNSIAASADADADADFPTSAEDPEYDAAPEAESATQNATEQASNTADSVKSAAQTAGEAITGAAQSFGAAAGLESQESEASSSAPDTPTSKVVYVGNLFFDVTLDDLKNEFGKAGPVVDAKIITDPRGLSKGFGYVTYETTEGAQRAIELYNLQNFEGRRLAVQLAIQKPAKKPQLYGNRAQSDRPINAPTRTLFIGNMSFNMSDRDLNNLFREIKNVIDVRVAIDRRTGQPRGFAHADFTDVPSAERAMGDLAGKVVCGRELRVDFSSSTGRSALGTSDSPGSP